MDGIEFLNLRTYRDLMRIRRDLKKQSEEQPLEQALALYRMYRPEIVNFVNRSWTSQKRRTQVHIDMEMARLLLKRPSPETAAEAHPILVETVQYLHRFLELINDPNIWQMQAECFHMLVECALQLDYDTQAESYCTLFHDACRNIAKFYNGPLYRPDHLELLEQLYQDTDRVFHVPEDPAKCVRAIHARVQLQRVKLWQAGVARLEEQRKLVETYQQMAAAYSRQDTPLGRVLAMEYCEKALAIIRSDLGYYRMRRAHAEVYLFMGELWMRYGDTESTVKAKECFVRSLDAAKHYLHDCIRRDDNTDPATELLRGSYRGLAAACGSLPGEKNARKKEKYRRLAEELET